MRLYMDLIKKKFCLCILGNLHLIETIKIPHKSLFVFFREYALEKIKHDFHANKSVSDTAVINQLIKTAEENLDIIRRQVSPKIVSSRYPPVATTYDFIKN